MRSQHQMLLSTSDRCGADNKAYKIEKKRIEGPNLRVLYNTLNGPMGSASNIPNDCTYFH